MTGRHVGSWQSPLGRIVLVCTDRRLTGLWFDGGRHYGSARDYADYPAEMQHESHPIFVQTRSWLIEYFAGKGAPKAVLPPILLEGTAFQRQVWQLLEDCPYGETIGYGTLASRYEAETGRHTSPRAVGSAVGRNPVSLIVPCHRVVGANGSLTGYAGNLDRKAFLLALERGNIQKTV